MQITHSFPSLTQLVESLNYRKWLASLTKNIKWRIKYFFPFFVLSWGLGGLKAIKFLIFPLTETLKRDKRWKLTDRSINWPLFWDSGQRLWLEPLGQHSVPSKRGLSRSRTGEKRQENARIWRAPDSSLKTSTPNSACHHCSQEFMCHCPRNLWNSQCSYQ